MVVMGTEFNDKFVVNRHGIYGAGKFIVAINVARLAPAVPRANQLHVAVLLTPSPVNYREVGDCVTRMAPTKES